MISTLAVAAAITLAAPADGDWPTRSGFDIFELEDGCAFEGYWPVEGRNDLQLAIHHDGDAPVVAISSSDWTSRPDQTFELAFFLNDHVYTGTATGLPRNLRMPGFSVTVSNEFISDFAAARTLLVKRGDTVVAHLNLHRTALAMTDLRACQQHVARENRAQAAREARVDYIARDPFAEPGQLREAQPGEDTVRPPVLTNPTWATPPRPTFPDRAAERGLTGSATLRCSINSNGSVTGCSVESETPEGAGFGRAAIAATRSARLSPRSVDGVAPGGTVRFTLNFDQP